MISTHSNRVHLIWHMPKKSFFVVLQTIVKIKLSKFILAAFEIDIPKNVLLYVKPVEACIVSFYMILIYTILIYASFFYKLVQCLYYSL